jgi:hypothetical protein
VFFGHRDINDTSVEWERPQEAALRSDLLGHSRAVRKANRTTKQTFDGPDALGTLIVWNNLVQILNPR